MKNLMDFIQESIITEGKNNYRLTDTAVEIMLCFAYNMQYFEHSDEGYKECLKISSKGARHNYQNVIDEYKKAGEDGNNIFDRLAQRLPKLENGIMYQKLYAESDITPLWQAYMQSVGSVYMPDMDGNITEEMKTNKQVNATPKTDIISTDGKVKITVKEGYGKSSLVCSCMFNETKALLMAAAEKCNSEVINYYLDCLFGNEEIFSAERGITRDDIKQSGEIKNRIEKKKGGIEALIRDKIQYIFNNSDFNNALIREAITGDVKYGKYTSASPNYIFIWTLEGEGNGEYQKINRFLDNQYI